MSALPRNTDLIALVDERNRLRKANDRFVLVNASQAREIAELMDEVRRLRRELAAAESQRDFLIERNKALCAEVDGAPY